MNKIEEKLLAIENRLQKIEQKLEIKSPCISPVQVIQPQVTPVANPTVSPINIKYSPKTDAPIINVNTTTATLPKNPDTSFSATEVLGYSGAIAMVLAIAYLIMLSVDAGLFTPTRQIGFAFIAGASLIYLGLKYRLRNASYFAILPSVGIITLYLAAYGAHNYYQMISPSLSLVLIILISSFALFLCHELKEDSYALFAVIGTYSAPFLLNTNVINVWNDIIYFTVWSVVFVIFAIKQRRRTIYLIALYLSLVGFNIIWNGRGEYWLEVLFFQTFQFLIFLAGIIYFSVKHQQPLSDRDASAHLPPLLFFYAIQYAILQTHFPALAPWISLISGIVILLASVIASKLLLYLEGAKVIINIYLALIIFHSLYLELLPSELAPWLGLVIVPISFCLHLVLKEKSSSLGKPIIFVIGLIFVVNIIRTIFQIEMQNVLFPKLLSVLYAVQFYGTYFYLHAKKQSGTVVNYLVYLGHLTAMAAIVTVFENRAIVSISWGALALGFLVFSLQTKNKFIGKSALLIFLASGLKVVLYDLSGATPVIRVICLMVLAATLYVGGLLNKKIESLES